MIVRRINLHKTLVAFAWAVLLRLFGAGSIVFAQFTPPPTPVPPGGFGGGTPAPTLDPFATQNPAGAGGPAGATLPEPSVTSINDFYVALKAIALWVLVFGVILG